MNRTEKIEKIIADVKKFVKDYKIPATGGYAPVTDEELDQIDNIVNSLIEMKYEQDLTEISRSNSN